ncbi:hypothetical protein JQ596_21260 [Bradyrhizobium manausense]|uniref:hypothetical protein n=1 Tax=Bradyrhizobium TaxID=374 RepID=UPI001BAABFD5|nr:MULTISPECIES: hypothetical protein [Bradyrhizobium]MBR0828067.1 hypothetical protein [Bradyrhizobium manausense]UVO32927.1 hypothetical protein KUF59_21065 [Bradyrhizobium arachidis]
MWASIRRLLARTKSLEVLFGDVLFESQPVRGQSSHSNFQWQVKRGLDEKSYYVCVKMKPDGYAGPEGSPTNYISFDLATALKLRADIDECIALAHSYAKAGSRSSAIARKP